MAKDTRIAFRTSEDLKERLQRAAKKVRLGETALAEAAVQATVEFIEKNGGIWFPLVVVPGPPRPDFKAVGESRGAAVGDPSLPSTRDFPSAQPEASGERRLDTKAVRKTAAKRQKS